MNRYLFTVYDCLQGNKVVLEEEYSKWRDAKKRLKEITPLLIKECMDTNIDTMFEPWVRSSRNYVSINSVEGRYHKLAYIEKKDKI